MKIQDVLKKHPQLNYHGLKPYSGWESGVEHLADESQYTKILDWVNQLEKTKKINYDTFSYALKHRCEEAIGEYVTNGQIIVAMILAGFDVYYLENHKNAKFNVSTKSLKNLIKKAKEANTTPDQ